MPSENEFVAIQTNFYATASFPRVIGTIDCTHIKIQSPGGIDAEIFRNRKSYFSINVQAIANADMIFTDIVARWPGSVHDSTIFNNTAIKTRDSGYPLRNYLLTPLANPVARAEQLYNESHIRTRNCIERVFGLWKRRFPVLAYGLRLKLDTILTVIIATAVLHNIAREMHEDLPEPPEDLNVDELNYLIATGNINEVISNIMPRRFIHKLGTSHRRDYPRERLENALRAVIEEHMSFGQAAEQFSVPKATLYDKYRGMHGDLLGRKPAMSVAEERYIVTALLKAAEFIVPFTEKDLMDFVEQYITRKGIRIKEFKDNRPGRDWVRNFLKRNSVLSHRNSQNIKRCRADLQPEIIIDYFEHLRTTVEGVPRANIVNFDETNITDDPGRQQVFVFKKAKHASRVMDFSKPSTMYSIH
ncbi:hypothetical protein MML48_2g00019108 [Holotrichia oblita]|uniref:Uncharacterized protein n=1 Tax=Holotrichia oblita TaxID=644536 RepID=A0ACB9TMR9_HOLOL|nr:hypothetical protein MML48_2g00019108 [Holotrichia oblita]